MAGEILKIIDWTAANQHVNEGFTTIEQLITESHGQVNGFSLTAALVSLETPGYAFLKQLLLEQLINQRLLKRRGDFVYPEGTNFIHLLAQTETPVPIIQVANLAHWTASASSETSLPVFRYDLIGTSGRLLRDANHSELVKSTSTILGPNAQKFITPLS